MTELTDEEAKALLDGATPGPWRADGEPWNRVVWSPNGNRVCFMAHSSGLDDARDTATSNLVAAAPDLARALLDARAELAQARAEAQAAVARAYEAAAERLDLAEHGAEERDWRSGANAFAALAKGLRALAPADGLAAVEALRAEIADLKMNMDADLRTMVREGQQLRTLAAELAAAQQREAALTKALEACVASLERVDTAEGVCCCGDSMDRHSDPMSCGHSPVDMGDYYAGQALESARAALAQTPTDPGDGWTWNERLGWIGPDGKPADPRRRG